MPESKARMITIRKQENGILIQIRGDFGSGVDIPNDNVQTVLFTLQMMQQTSLTYAEIEEESDNYSEGVLQQL